MKKLKTIHKDFIPDLCVSGVRAEYGILPVVIVAANEAVLRKVWKKLFSCRFNPQGIQKVKLASPNAPSLAEGREMKSRIADLEKQNAELAALVRGEQSNRG